MTKNKLALVITDSIDFNIQLSVTHGGECVVLRITDAEKPSVSDIIIESADIPALIDFLKRAAGP